jgi:hypothetical protein
MIARESVFLQSIPDLHLDHRAEVSSSRGRLGLLIPGLEMWAEKACLTQGKGAQIQIQV